MWGIQAVVGNRAKAAATKAPSGRDVVASASVSAPIRTLHCSGNLIFAFLQIHGRAPPLQFWAVVNLALHPTPGARSWINQIHHAISCPEACTDWELLPAELNVHMTGRFLIVGYTEGRCTSCRSAIIPECSGACPSGLVSTLPIQQLSQGSSIRWTLPLYGRILSAWGVSPRFAHGLGSMRCVTPWLVSKVPSFSFEHFIHLHRVATLSACVGLLIEASCVLASSSSSSTCSFPNYSKVLHLHCEGLATERGQIQYFEISLPRHSLGR